jgi:hypothetical protein
MREMGLHDGEVASLYLTAELGHSEFAQLFHPGTGVSCFEITDGSGFSGGYGGGGEPPVKVQISKSALVRGQELRKGTTRLYLHGDRVPAGDAMASDSRS